MKIMHKVLLGFFVLIISMQNLFAEPRYKVATTFTILADMVSHVAGSDVEVVSITKAGADIHSYQPTPRDVLKIKSADILFWNGLGLELWFEKFFNMSPNVPKIVLTEKIEPVSIGKGPYEGKANPHAWMSQKEAMLYVDAIIEGLSAFDPQHALEYQKRGAAYKKQIKLSFEPLRAVLNALDDQQKWLVTSEGAFSYLIRDLGVKELYLWPINADAQGTPLQVRRVIDKVRAHNIPVIFSESTISPDPALQVARETNIHYGGVLYVDSLSDEGGPVQSYLDLLRVNAQTIAEGFQKGLEKRP